MISNWNKIIYYYNKKRLIKLLTKNINSINSNWYNNRNNYKYCRIIKKNWFYNYNKLIGNFNKNSWYNNK